MLRGNLCTEMSEWIFSAVCQFMHKPLHRVMQLDRSSSGHLERKPNSWRHGTGSLCISAKNLFQTVHLIFTTERHIVAIDYTTISSSANIHHVWLPIHSSADPPSVIFSIHCSVCSQRFSSASYAWNNLCKLPIRERYVAKSIQS